VIQLYSSEAGAMQPTGETTIQIKRRIIVGLIVLPLFMGSAAFMNILGTPQFENIRSIDVVRLIAVGACGGVALVGLVILLRWQFFKKLTSQ